MAEGLYRSGETRPSGTGISEPTGPDSTYAADEEISAQVHRQSGTRAVDPPPEEQGMAMAIFGMGVVLAPAMGPILGGWLIDHYGWPWVFYINIPVSIVGIVMFSAFVEDPPYLRRGIARVDWVGIALLTSGLTLMQIVLERGHEHNWFHSGWITIGTLMTILMLTALVFWELRSKEPIINFRVLRNIPLSIGAMTWPGSLG